MSLTLKVLIGLAAGLAAGILLSRGLLPPEYTARAIAIAEPAGTLFINAIRMTVIPLVVASLIVGVATAPDPRTIGRLGTRALVLFLVTLVAAGTLAALVGAPILARLPVNPEAAEALRAASAGAAAGAAENAKRIPTFAQWLVDLVPTNPFKAASDGAMLPLIVFAVAFGLAATRIETARREMLVRFFQAVADASIVLVRWIIALAPIGVFALALPLAARMGVSAIGALASYVGLVAALCTAFIVLVLYPAGIIGGRLSARTFAQATLPAQAVAFSARSSLAALPAMIEEARTRFGAPPEITGFFLPLAASVFRAGSAIAITLGALFIARLYGVDLSATQVATIVVTTILTTFSVPGVPAGSILVMIPVLAAANIPVEGIGILLGVDTIPDMFRTTTNVTAHMSVAAILRRGSAADAAPRIERQAGDETAAA